MNIFWAEFFGTMMLIIFGDGVVANVLLGKSKGQNSGWIVIATGWGMAVLIAVYCVNPYSGAHINPAVTIGLACIGSTPWSQVPAYLIAQFLGAFVGGVIVFLAYKQHFDSTEDGALKRAVFCTAPAIRNTGWNLLTEIIGTFTLLFGVVTMLSKNNLLVHSVEPNGPSLNLAPPWVPFIVGMLVWGIGLSLGGPTGYAINPARDLGPRIAHAVLPVPGKGNSDFSYGWIPVVGPIIGGILGAIVGKWIAGLPLPS